jgi:hypothetical protein
MQRQHFSESSQYQQVEELALGGAHTHSMALNFILQFIRMFIDVYLTWQVKSG